MGNGVDPTAEERLFLILARGHRPGSALPAQPARVSRTRRTPVDNQPEQAQAGWTPPPWPDLLDHEIALTAHARRVRSGAVLTTVLEES